MTNKTKIIAVAICLLSQCYTASATDKDVHLRQLNAINTMVGTAQANTKAAGLFGKGSEEHGQTLPAVLVPHGQNFWTPQTQDTELKCIAPYYYKDTTLQGFRNSHWIVGGCTQDYGSFTVATIADSLRLAPTDRATRFSHSEEVSHPHYYSVHLPDEHLVTEMTALSHTSMLRITSERKQLIHIIVNANSDEQQGGIEIDTVKHIIYGYNPAHRIYQGWGEPAGFAGHFVLHYEGKIVDCGTAENSTAWITFSANEGEKIVVSTASSFTGREGAMSNLHSEMTLCHSDFDTMMTLCQDKWVERLHAIDVEDDDEGRVNQFYGALYRASFLPHEVSDCDGSYPKFADGAIMKGKGTVYGDFSMWDIYRAELPLLNIISPTMSGEMMQSLVNMYEEGGWMPIFPCWNSYTAAMIGDHCDVAIADAYVKGVRSFDVAKAYEGLRKNAFEQPATYEEYKNGMGRRALESYMKYGFIPMEDSVKEAHHYCEQTSRTLEYAFDDFALAQLAKALLGEGLNDKGLKEDYQALMRRSTNWRKVINPATGYADGRHADGSWENNDDHTHRKSYITEGATCHYTWYVPHDISGLMRHIAQTSSTKKARKELELRLDTLFETGRYWHGNEPCHQIAYMYNHTDAPWKTQKWVRQILETEYNNTPGGLSGNDDAGQMSAWYIFSAMGFYPVCPSTPEYEVGFPMFRKVTLNLENGRKFTIERRNSSEKCNKKTVKSKHLRITHDKIMNGGTLIIDDFLADIK